MSGFKNGYALIIGIANYPQVRKLPQTIVKDARDITSVLSAPSHCGYLQSNIQLMLDHQATAAGIRQAMAWLAQSVGRDDTAIIFFSGHGGRIERGKQATNYLLPFDCDPAKLKDTAISGEEFTNLLRNIQAQRLLVLFDCCHAGGIGEPKALDIGAALFKSGLQDKLYQQLAQGTGRVIIASSRPDELSWAVPWFNNSLFTHFLLEGLRGQAHTRGDGLIRVFDLFDYVSQKVPSHASQHPIFKAAELENNFPIALYLGGKQAASRANPHRTQSPRINKRTLREAIVKKFSMEELDLLCADIEQALTDDGIELQVSLSIAGGTTKPHKVLKLINFLERNEYLSYLINEVRQVRPGII